MDIKKWCHDNNALKRTETAFWNCFSVYQQEDYEEFISVFPEKEHGVKIEFERVAHEISLPDFEQELIAVYLNIFLHDKNIGWFKQLYLTDGTEFDEYFVIE